MNYLRWMLIWVCGCVSAACSYDPAALIAQADALAQQQQQSLAEQYHYQVAPESPETVIKSEQFYVPELAKSSADKPIWYSQPLQTQLTKVPLLQALQTVFTPLNVAVLLDPEIAKDTLISSDFSGTVGEWLAWLSNGQQLFIEYEPYAVHLKRYQVKRYDLAFLAGSTQFSLNEQGSQHVGADKAGQLGFKSAELSVWNELEKSVSLMLSANGEMALNANASALLIKDTPSVIKHIDRYIGQLNASLTRQVALDVQVIEVRFSDNEQYTVDWSSVRRNSQGAPWLSSQSGSESWLQQAAGQFILSPLSGPRNSIDVLVQALQQQGQVKVSHHPRILTLNHQVAQLLVEEQQAYLAESEVSSTPYVGRQQRLKPGSVTTGFRLFVLANILQRDVLLHLSSQMSALKGMSLVQSGDNMIQTPHTSRKHFFLKALVGHSETLLLTGFRNQHTEAGQTRSGISWLLGGGQQQTQENSETLLLITPRIVGVNDD
ncbi:type IVB pilus formation R64 PilN family outer membrane protein [Idiomarina fontislapidosi]|uniref:Type II/III secretion system secretin-like domain-containing protein n=1 Tax=Idiomarina fontislapidosi TaxID=263723 RepID=A0A432YB08_9GAMM|nr:hypothetical protein [Idiomarina fontislapidosi]PYE35279.1 type IVB pilus formation R64 PilN family outer membrane protein [Idiomarina fontislapidosi]RUO58168.1 hypothetical protein CWE25_00790 [Idiomarina fontislapidosi]